MDRVFKNNLTMQENHKKKDVLDIIIVMTMFILNGNYI